MAITFDAASTADTTGGTSLTWAHVVSGANRLLVVAAETWDNTGSLTATYNGVAMTEEATVEGGEEIYLFTLVDPDTGSNNVVITRSNTGAEFAGGAVSYNGSSGALSVRSGSPAANANGSSSTPSISISSAVGDLVVDGITVLDEGDATVGSGQTERVDNNNDAAIQASIYMSEEAGAASVAMGWTFVDAQISESVGLSIEEAPASLVGRTRRPVISAVQTM